MKTYFTLAMLLLHLSVPAHAQVILNESFEDGDFSADPEWVGDDSNWLIVEENGNNLLRLNADEAGQSWLSTASVAGFGRWEFSVRLDGFTTSNANRAHVFLMSDRSDTREGVNGYAVRIGESGSNKFFRIVRFDDGSPSRIIVTGETLIEPDVMYRVRVIRSNEGEWSLYVSDDPQEPPAPEGTPAVDTHWITSSWFGVRATYTATRADRFFFDDFYIEKNPVFLADFEVVDASTLRLTFSEEVIASSVGAETISILRDDQVPVPQPEFALSGRILELFFEQPLAGGAYELQAGGITDTAGGILEATSISFFVEDVAESGDVVINEFFFDITAGWPQYVELLNRSGKTLNLRDWRIQDNTTTIRPLTTSDLYIEPNELLVLTGDKTGLELQFGPGNYLELGNFPNLNRASPDQIKIFDAQQLQIDSLLYVPAEWGGTGVALERRAPDAVSYSSENWQESTHPLGGTPGTPNTAVPDDEPLSVESLMFTGSQSLRLRFNRDADTESAQNAANYQFEGIIQINEASQVSARETELTLSMPMLPSTSYTLTVSNVETIFGVPMPPETRTFTYYNVVPVETGDVVINEFMYRAADGWSRFIELYNRADNAFDLSGWTYNNDTGNRRVITDESHLLVPGAYVVLAPNAALLDIFPELPLINMGTRFSALKLGGDDIVIRDAEGVLVDSLTYRPSWGGFEVSLERRSADAPSWFSDNWADSPGSLPGTPGAPNLIPPDLTPPELLQAAAPEENRIRLQYSKAMHEAAALNPLNYFFESAVGIETIIYEGDEVELQLSDGLESGESVIVVLQNQQDIFGNPLGETQAEVIFYDFEPAEPFDIIINEFFYEDSADDGPPQYVELFNRSDKIINLRGWRIQDNTTTIRRLTLNDRAILPGEYVVLTREISRFENWFGQRNTIVVSNFPSLNRASADRIRIFSQDEVQIDSLQYVPAVWGAAGAALERRSSEAISYAADNWLPSTNPQLGTPGLPNTAEPDSLPPVFTALSYTDSQTLTARFSRHIDAITAEEPGNFDFSGDPDISALQKIAPREVEIRLSTAMNNGTSYSLTVQGIASIFGVPMPEQERSFTFFELAQPDSGTVHITEFMYDRPDGYSRYVEIFNSGAFAFDLQGWTLSNDTGNPRVISTDSYLVAPGAFVVLAPDESLRDIFPDVPLIDMGSRFPALKTGGDAIVLRSLAGVLIDSLSYQPNWGGREIALERRTTEVAAWYPENWGDSPAEQLGTPGMPNAILPDTTPPDLRSVTATGPQQITLSFSKNIAPETAAVLQNYHITPDPGISEIILLERGIDLVLDTPLESGSVYQITLQNLQDVFGNPLVETVVDFTYLDFEPAGRLDLVINEILYRPIAAEVPRFIEVYNRSDKNLNLQGWRLGRSLSTIALNSDSGQIPLKPGGLLVITESPALLGLSADDSRVLKVPALPAFSQNGDAVYLRSDGGLTIDSLHYAPSWAVPQPGQSIERIDPESASNDPANWAGHPEGHSAGEQNAVFQPNQHPPGLRFASRTEDGLLELRFTEFVRPDEQTRFAIDGVSLQPHTFNPDQADLMILSGLDGGPVPLFTGAEQTVQVTRLRDVPGNQATELEIPVAQQLQAGDVILNEIMYQPLSGSSAGFPDQSQYVELHNRRDYAINLRGFHIHDEPDFEGEVRRIFPERTENAWIAANGYAVMYADTQRDFSATRIARFFNLGVSDEAAFFRADRTTLNLRASAGAVFLAGAEGEVIDSVFYEASWHNPNLADARGIALERINPEGASNEASNWGSSVVPAGGTPGTSNSLFQQPGPAMTEEGLTLEPNPFSPDGDGVDDNLFLSYVLDEPDYLLRVRIYDRHGRLVRTLADGRPAGLSGSLIWDGRRDNGMENRVGIYIVLFEAYNSATGRTKTFRQTVVLARRL
ncbi:lamin tail domain-containing protein [Cyclonatronum proteinivorum]|uniref:lamin tail domain-containing protein n=1 Tax=Cyclonatronum proteinivorum TaxID=1457365 RepID=UPI0013DF9786|nr:lamin tail domain-containing protein [Cyclonatronum proteinivorum]